MLRSPAPGAGAHGSPAELHALAGVGAWTNLFVQPQDPIDPAAVGVSHLHAPSSTPFLEEQWRRNLAACLTWVRDNPAWRLSIQAHKVLGLP